MSEEKSQGEKDKAEIEQLKNRNERLQDKLKEANTDKVLLENQIKRLAEEHKELTQDKAAVNQELEEWRKKVKHITEDAHLGIALAETGKKQLALAKGYLQLADMPFLSSRNRQGLSQQSDILEKEAHESFIRPLQDISTLFLKAKTDFEGYNQHYIAYVKGLTWWQRIWRNHGKTGINRAYRNYQEMSEQFENIQRQCNERLVEMLKESEHPNFYPLYDEVKNQLILAAEQQLVEMRRNYFDSSNLNPHSYATYLLCYISRLKKEQPREQNNVIVVEGENAFYQPIFAKEQIKPLYEQFKNEYEKRLVQG